jgi:hypothetical protein
MPVNQSNRRIGEVGNPDFRTLPQLSETVYRTCCSQWPSAAIFSTSTETLPQPPASIYCTASLPGWTLALQSGHRTSAVPPALSYIEAAAHADSRSPRPGFRRRHESESTREIPSPTLVRFSQTTLLPPARLPPGSRNSLTPTIHFFKKFLPPADRNFTVAFAEDRSRRQSGVSQGQHDSGIHQACDTSVAGRDEESLRLATTTSSGKVGDRSKRLEIEVV